MRPEAAARDAVTARARAAMRAAAVAVPGARRRSVEARSAAGARLLLAVLGVAPIGETLLLRGVGGATIRLRRVAATGKRGGADKNKRYASGRLTRALRHRPP